MRELLLHQLAEENPGVQKVELEVFLDTLEVYRKARANIAKHGPIVLHPRTSQPIENPYLKVQQSSGALLSKMRMIESNLTLAVLEAEEARLPPADIPAPAL